MKTDKDWKAIVEKLKEIVIHVGLNPDTPTTSIVQALRSTNCHQCAKFADELSALEVGGVSKSPCEECRYNSPRSNGESRCAKPRRAWNLGVKGMKCYKPNEVSRSKIVSLKEANEIVKHKYPDTYDKKSQEVEGVSAEEWLRKNYPVK